MTHTYGERDVILYALGVGCGAEPSRFTYERDLEVLPTFAVVPAFPALLEVVAALRLDPLTVVHTEHRIDLHAPIPPRGRITTTAAIEAIGDRGTGALIVVAMESADEKGRPLFRNRAALFARGLGGFGGDRGPRGPRSMPPPRPPEASVALATRPDQAVLYRLSGDPNPIHVDPEISRMAGFPRPILHGLCTFGFAGRALVEAFCDGRPERLRSLEARFAGAVFPGETIRMDAWRTAPDSLIFAARSERGTPALSAGAAEVAP